MKDLDKENIKTFSIREYSTGDFMDLGSDAGIIKAKDIDNAWELYKETHRLKDNERGFYSLKEVLEAHKNQIPDVSKMVAYKETSNKLNYELDFNFITQLAERMAQNKHKYEPYNWQKLDNIEELKQALLRHVLEVMKGNYEDDNRLFGHLESIALNAMFINYQLNKKENDKANT